MTDYNSRAYKNHDLKRGVDFIGVGVCFICHDGNGKYLLHKRSCNCRDEVGNWDCGGGCVEFGESFEEAVRREIMEEYGVEVEELNFVDVRNVLRQNGEHHTHWVSLLYKAKVDPEKVKINDPEKMDDIGWFEEFKWPQPLHSFFLNHFNHLKKMKNN